MATLHIAKAYSRTSRQPACLAASHLTATSRDFARQKVRSHHTVRWWAMLLRDWLVPKPPEVAGQSDQPALRKRHQFRKMQAGLQDHAEEQRRRLPLLSRNHGGLWWKPARRSRHKLEMIKALSTRIEQVPRVPPEKRPPSRCISCRRWNSGCSFAENAADSRAVAAALAWSGIGADNSDRLPDR